MVSLLKRRLCLLGVLERSDKSIQAGTLVAEQTNGQWFVLLDRTKQQTTDQNAHRAPTVLGALSEEQIEKFRRRVEAAQREQNEREPQIHRRQVAGTTSASHKGAPKLVTPQRPQGVLSQILVSLLIGLVILGSADYAIVGDSIPFVAEPTAVVIVPARGMSEPTPDTSPSPGAIGGAVQSVPITLPSTVATALPSAAPTTEPTPTSSPTLVAFGEPAGGWPQRSTGTLRASALTNGYQIVLEGQTNATISTDLPDVDYQLSLDVTIERGSAGVIFLAAEPATFYRLLFNTDGAYALQTIDQADQITILVDWTESNLFRRGTGTSSQLRIERAGNTIRFFANGAAFASFTVPQGQFSNRYGFALTAPDGNAAATFANLQGTYVATP